MNIVRFQHSVLPCIDTPVTRWHVAHGFVWDVLDVRSGEYLGVFYATLLCFDASVIHFDTLGNVSPAQLLSGFRKGISMILTYSPVVYATVSPDKKSLVKLLSRVGFRVVPDGGYQIDGFQNLLLKYFGTQKGYIVTVP